MRWTQSFITTLREPPSDAELISHRLMVRAGLISKLSSGVYIYRMETADFVSTRKMMLIK